MSVLALVLASASPAAWACPNCDTAQTVRAWMFQTDFWERLSLILLPLVVLAAIVSQLDRVGRAERRERS
jgi:hypothetical protein